MTSTKRGRRAKPRRVAGPTPLARWSEMWRGRRVCERCGSDEAVHRRLCRHCRAALRGEGRPIGPEEPVRPHQGPAARPPKNPPWRRRGA